MVAAAVIAILSPVVKLFVEVGERALGGPTAQQRECTPVVPPPEDRPL